MSDLELKIYDLLTGDTQKTALDFAAFLQAEQMVATGGEVSYNGKVVCYMHIDGADSAPGPWTVWSEGDYSKARPNVPMDGGLLETAWAHINFCANCGGECSPGSRKVIFGREFDGVCSADMAFYKPGACELETIKRLLLTRKQQIIENERKCSNNG